MLSLNLDSANAEEAFKKAKDLAVYLRKIPEHWVPFGHPHISLRMEAPIAIARQLFKHKIGMVESEESRRYIKSEPIIFIPEHFRAAPEGSIKQGSAGVHIRSDEWKKVYTEVTAHVVSIYLDMIADGVAPEMARLVLPQGAEVHWALTGSLYAFANMYNQRADGHAQKESQEIARQIDAIIAPLYPVSWAALTRGDY
jgi:thymidylate synthase (FAD)